MSKKQPVSIAFELNPATVPLMAIRELTDPKSKAVHGGTAEQRLKEANKIARKALAEIPKGYVAKSGVLNDVPL